MSELRAWIVYRINWLRARAKKTRWAEEAVLIPMEMVWTVNFFMNKVSKWEEFAARSPRKGPRGYAYKQAGMWRQLGEQATILFDQSRMQYTVN